MRWLIVAVGLLGLAGCRTRPYDFREPLEHCPDATSCPKQVGACSLDTECGAGRWCSPDVPPCALPATYYCHTADDECLDDRDCPQTGALPEKCHYSFEVGHWMCGVSVCSG